jgi:hypothetical protein
MREIKRTLEAAIDKAHDPIVKNRGLTCVFTVHAVVCESSVFA